MPDSPFLPLPSLSLGENPRGGPPVPTLVFGQLPIQALGEGAGPNPEPGSGQAGREGLWVVGCGLGPPSPPWGVSCFCMEAKVWFTSRWCVSSAAMGAAPPPPKPVGGRMVSLLDGGPYQTKLTRVNFPLVGNPLSGRPLHHGPYW